MGKVKALLPAEPCAAADMLHDEPDAELEALQRALRPHLDEAERRLRLLRGQWEGVLNAERVHGAPGKWDLDLARLHAAKLTEALRRAFAARAAHDAQVFRADGEEGRPW